jgi:uncharacterized membrane protein YhfC
MRNEAIHTISLSDRLVNILSVTYFLNGFLMIAMPIGLTIYLTRKFKQGWRLFWIGGAIFIFSQVLHIPFNALVSPVLNQFGFIALPVIFQNVILSVFLGLSAGLFEELSRYAMYRWWAKEARSWGMGLLAGAGHGGGEAIILGLLVLYGYIQMLIVRGMDISTLVSPDKVELAKAQIQAYWSAPWYMTMLGALERLFSCTGRWHGCFSFANWIFGTGHRGDNRYFYNCEHGDRFRVASSRTYERSRRAGAGTCPYIANGIQIRVGK